MVNYNSQSLQDLTFENEDLSSTPFIDTILTNCTFINCTLDYCQFLNSTLSGSIFTNCSFIGTDFNSSNFQNIAITGSSFLDTNFSNAVFQDYSIFKLQDDFSHCNFTSVNLQSIVELTGKILKNCLFVNTDFTSSVLENVDFSFSRFDNANFANALLSNLNLDDTLLQNLDFSGLDLSNNISLRNSMNEFISKDDSTILPVVAVGDRSVSYEIRTSGVADKSGQSVLSYLIGPFLNFENKNLNGINFQNLDLTSVNLQTNQLQNCKTIGMTYEDPPILLEGYKIVKSGIVGAYMNIVSADLSDEDLSSVNFYSVKTRLNIANENTIFPPQYGYFGREVNGQTLGSVVGPDVVLIQAELEDLDLSEANLSGIRSGETRTNDNTVLPTGYKAVGGYVLGPYVSLQQVNLTNLDLTGVDFTGSIFKNTKVEGTVISDETTIIPEGYVVSEGYLIGPHINISGIDFASTPVDFSQADLTEVRSGNMQNYENVTFPSGYSITTSGFLIGPQLSLVNSILFDSETFSNVDFTGTDLTSANLTNCIFESCTFIDTQLSGTNFTGSRFTSCNFGTGLEFININFASTEFSGETNIFDVGANFTNCSFANINFLSSYLVSNKTFISCDFSSAIMSSDFSNTIFNSCNMSNADMSLATLIGCVGFNLTESDTILPSDYAITGGTMISTNYSLIDEGILLEPETPLTDDTLEVYIPKMLTDIVEEEYREDYTVEPSKRIFLNTSTLEKLSGSDLLLTEIINSDNINSQVVLDDVKSDVAYFVTLFNIGEELIVNLPFEKTLKIRKRNEKEFDVTKENVKMTVQKGFTDEYHGFHYTLGSVYSYYTPEIENSDLPISDICFPAGEFVLTNEGYVDIKYLTPSKHKINEKSIKRISKTKTREKYLVQIEKNALGTNQPNKTTLVSQKHQVLFNRGWFCAGKLTSLDFITNVPYKDQVLYNVELETPDTMMVNNMIVETLNEIKP